MVLVDIDDDCCSDPLICLRKTMKTGDLTAKMPFEVYENYYEEYKTVIPGTVFVLVIILATIVHMGLIILLWKESESVTAVHYPNDISIKNSNDPIYLDTTLGVQLYVPTTTSTTSFTANGFFQSTNAWQNSVKVQWVRCDITTTSRTCTNLGWKICDNGICPDVSEVSTLYTMNPLYGPPYSVVGMLVAHCNSTDIPLSGTTGYTGNTLTCSNSDTYVRSELNNAVIATKQKNYLPEGLEKSFLESSYSLLTDRMDTTRMQLIDYLIQPYKMTPLSTSYFTTDASVTKEGLAGVLDEAVINEVPTSTSHTVFGSMGSPGISINPAQTYGFYQFGLHAQIYEYTVDESKTTTLMANFGSWVVLIFILAHFIKMINMRRFWAGQDLVRDSDNDQLLQAITNAEPSATEDQLLYTLTLGGTKKFGWQTKHLFNYYQAGNKDNDYLRRITLPLDKFLCDQRIEEGVNQSEGDEKHEDALDKEARENLKEEIDPDVKKEMFVSIALYHITAEMTKLKQIVATELSGESKQYRLEAKLQKLE